MRLICNLGWMLVLAICFSACFHAPEFPLVPSISFNNVEFIETSRADTLVLTINFKDGNGDLGLDQQSEIDYPHNDKFYFRESDGTPGYFDPLNTAFSGAGNTINLYGVLNVHQPSNPFGAAHDITLVRWSSKLHTPGYDTLPDFIVPYSCTNWEIVPDPNADPLSDDTTDTLYFQANPHQNNIFIDFYVQQADDSYKKYEWSDFGQQCLLTGYNGRFPILSRDLSKPSAQEGKIRYAMSSVAWNSIFGVNYIKIGVYIEDRALNRSNYVLTDRFQLKGI